MKDYQEYNPFITGVRLRNAISDAGMTRFEFAEKVGISKKTCDAYVSGHSNPSLKKLFKISLELGVTADYLMGLTDENLT